MAESYRFGKHPPKLDYRTLRLKSYLTAALKPAPTEDDVLQRVYQKLGVPADPTKLFPIDGNDRVGDCTIAGMAHAITAYSGLVGRERIATTKAVLKLYRHLTGGADTGLNELDVLNYWRHHRAFGDEILAYASVDPKNHAHVKQAIHLFGGVYLGFQVQENAVEDFNARKVWTPGRLSHDGHAVYAVGYDAGGVTVLTWGNTQKGTWGWWDECVDEAYAIVPPQARQPDFAPGFDLKQLEADLKDVAD